MVERAARRAIGSRELLAVDPRAIQRDADGIFLLFGSETPENECVDGVSVVHVRGPLDHHRGFGDNYDEIRERMQCAFEDDESHAVIARIDSPGGVVAGLLDTVRMIREMSEISGKRSVAYVDENAFSAAYALCCAFDEIVLPPSAICGSIGVISTMCDQVEFDKAHGFNFVTITSGARKADGHPHVAITDAMISAEQRRVDKLAGQFFSLVNGSRGIPKKAVAGFQAGLFLGKEAVGPGVADRVATFDALLAELAGERGSTNAGLAKVAQRGTQSKGGTPNAESEMTHRAALLKELKAAKASLAAAKDADKPEAKGRVAGLQAALDAYKKVTEKHVEHSKTHEEDEGDEDDEGAEGNETDRSDDPEDDEDDDKDDGDKKAAAPAKKASASSKKKAMYDEEESAESEDEEAEAALVQLVRKATGKTGAAAQGALTAMLSDHKTMRTQLAAIRSERASEKRDATISVALAAHRITKREAKVLREKPQAHIDAFLEARPNALFSTSDADLPNPIPPQRDASGNPILPPELEKQLQAAIQASGGTIKREDILKDFGASEARRNGSNGAAPRE